MNSQTASTNGSNRTSLRSRGTTHSVASTSRFDKFSKSDLVFLCSMKGIGIKTSDTIAQLTEHIGGFVTEEQRDLVREFNSDDQEFTKKVQEQGWFMKTYQAVRHYIDSFVKEHYGKTLVYNNLPQTTKGDKYLITRLLRFCEMNDLTITLRRVHLTFEQLAVANLERAMERLIKYTESGPGSGKTTTLIHQAKNHCSQGVICVAYTNAAVNHIVRTLKDLVNDIDDIGTELRRIKPKGEAKEEIVMAPPRILVCTIDKLVPYFTSRKLGNVKDNEAFDTYIMETLDENNMDMHHEFFYNRDGSLVYNHIIVDEAQDLSKPRFTFLMRLFKYIRASGNNENTNSENSQTITFYGDPRQRIVAKAGYEYQQLGVLNEYEGIPIRKHAFTRTFRFENTQLLSLCNKLSEIRPDIHVQMVPAEECFLDKKIKVFSCTRDIAETIIDLIKRQNVIAHQICIIYPAPNKSNCSSTKQTKEIVSILATQGISTCKEFKDGSVLYDSIHSTKGLEFDYVIFVGSENFPDAFAQVYEMNDSVSLNFVVNTRARKQLFYMSNENYEIPRNVPQELTENGTTARRYTIQYRPLEAIASCKIDDADYRKFEETNTFTPDEQSINNGFSLNTRHITTFEPSNYQYEIISGVLAYIKGLTIPQRATAKHRDTQEIINLNMYSGISYDLTMGRGSLGTDGLCYISRDEESLFDKLNDDYLVENIEMHKNYHRLITRSESSLVDMSQINNVIMKIVSLLGVDPQRDNRDVIHTTANTKIKASCIVSNSVIIVFSASFHLCSLVKAENKNKRVLSVSLSRGQVIEITDAPYQPHRYKYYLEALYSITAHNYVLRSRQSLDVFQKPIFFVDTEFVTTKTDKRKTIYDIAIINGTDIYKSIVTLVDCGRMTFDKAVVNSRRGKKLGEGIQFRYDDFRGSPTIDQIFTKFCMLISSVERPELHHFDAKHDVAWITEQFLPEVINEKPTNNDETTNTDDRDVVDNIVDDDNEEIVDNDKTDYGVEIVNDRRLPELMTNGRAIGKLSEIYNRITCSNQDIYRHIQLHTAVSDTILLYELIRTIRSQSFRNQ
jgi:hypothetical protein